MNPSEELAVKILSWHAGPYYVAGNATQRHRVIKAVTQEIEMFLANHGPGPGYPDRMVTEKTVLTAPTAVTKV